MYLITYIILILKLNHDNHFLVSVTLCKFYKYWVLNLQSELTTHEIIRAAKIVLREVVTKSMFIT